MSFRSIKCSSTRSTVFSSSTVSACLSQSEKQLLSLENICQGAGFFFQTLLRLYSEKSVMNTTELSFSSKSLYERGHVYVSKGHPHIKEFQLPKYANIQMDMYSSKSFHKKYHTFMYPIRVADNNSEVYLEDKTSVYCGRWYKRCEPTVKIKSLSTLLSMFK